jgi:hypothetical protein
MPAQRVAVARATGVPKVAAEKVLPALYGGVYILKFALKKQGVEFKVGALRARWPNANTASIEDWKSEWALPLPDGATEVPQKDPNTPVTVETWQYGAVAQLLHVGPWDQEAETIERLHKFIEEQGYTITGVHEEEYLTTPKAKVQKTNIRYPDSQKQDVPAR